LKEATSILTQGGNGSGHPPVQQQARQVGDYQLVKLIAEGRNYQDWEGKHVAAGVLRRVRIYGYDLAATADARKSLIRQATRELQIRG